MRIIPVLLTMAAIFALHAADAQTHKTKKMNVIIDEEEDVPPPSSADEKKPPVSLSNWFFTFANTPVTGKPVQYKVTVFGSGSGDGDPMQHLFIGSGEWKNKSAGPKGYQYVQLKKEEYKGLDLRQVIEKLQAQVKSFLHMMRFKQTAFGKAGTVSFLFDDLNVIELK